MIVPRGVDLWRLARELGPLLTALLAYDIVVTAMYVALGWRWVDIPDLPLPLLGSAIVVVVTLRNNAAYARWWEGRGLWGAVVNNSRSFARGLVTLTDDRGLQDRLVRLQIGYALALRCHLLREAPWDTLAPYVQAATLADLRGMANVPAGIQVAIGRALAASDIDVMARVGLDRTLSALADAQGGLERIKNTPMPRQYAQFPMVFSRIYCVALPLGLIGNMGILTPLGSTVIGFMFLAPDRIGRDLEDPFDGSMHNLPMHAISRTIEIDLLQTIGATPVPAAIQPVDGVLW